MIGLHFLRECQGRGCDGHGGEQCSETFEKYLRHEVPFDAANCRPFKPTAGVRSCHKDKNRVKKSDHFGKNSERPSSPLAPPLQVAPFAGLNEAGPVEWVFAALAFQHGELGLPQRFAAA